MGGACGDAGVSAATRGLSAVWDSDRAGGVRGPEGAAHAPVAPADRRRLPIDATSHAAVRHDVSWGKARRAEKAFLAEWDRTG